MEMSEEQKAMQEKLKNMSPEELKEYQKQNCIFCHIVSGKVPSKKIYEDDKALAILDINPATKGHILLLPKEHYSIMPQIPENVIAHLFMVAKALSNSMLKSMGCKGTNIFVANGAAAGQKAQHFMLHVIPRYDDDGVSQLNVPEYQVNQSDMEKMAEQLRENARQMGALKKGVPRRKRIQEEENKVEASQDQEKQEEKVEGPKEELKEESLEDNVGASEEKQEVDKEEPKEPVTEEEKKEEKKEVKEEEPEEDEAGIDLDTIANFLGK